jgi:hypothetical protein
MIRILSFLFLILSSLAAASQHNILLVRKNNKTIKTFFEGKYIAFDTKQKSTASGIITKISKDSLFVRYFDIIATGTPYGGVYFDTSFRFTTAIHVSDIGALHPFSDRSGRARSGMIMMVAGGGILVLGAVNGLYRGDKIKEWYKPASFITAGAFAAAGYLWRKSSKKKLVIGRKYQLKILSIN